MFSLTKMVDCCKYL